MMQTLFSRTATRTPLYNLAIGGAFTAVAVVAPAPVSEGSSKLALDVTRTVRVTQ